MPNDSLRLPALLLLLSGFAAASAAGAAVLVPPRASVVENRGEIAIALERRANLAGVLELQLTTFPVTATENEDFTPTTTTLSWAGGEGGLRELVIPILDDRRLERNEVFGVSVEVTRGRDQISNSRILVLIEEDDYRRLAERRLAESGGEPVIATETAGRRLVLFTTPLGVAAGFLTRSGTPIGLPFLVRENQDLTFFADAPAVAGGRAGRFFVAWRVTLPGSGESRIEGRAFDRGGNPLGPVVELGGSFSGRVGRPRIAVSDRGQAVVLFSDPDGRLIGRIAAPGEILSPTIPPGATESLADVPESSVRLARSVVDLRLDDFGAATDYQLAAAPTLGFVVVARPSEPTLAASRQPSRGLGDVNGTILAQAFGFDGESRSGIVAISSDLSATRPSVAVSAEGQIVIGWSEASLEGDLDPRIAFFGRGLAIVEPLEVLEIERPGSQLGVVVAMNSAGDNVAVWAEQPTSGGSSSRPTGATRRASEGGTGASLVARAFDAGGMPKGDELEVATSDAETEPVEPSVTVSDDDVINVAFERRSSTTGVSAGIFDQQIEKAITEGVCRPDGKTLCLNGLRFQVSASWADAEFGAGVANARELTDDTGTFWFFDEDNVEIVLKVLDACTFSRAFWVFAGGLTDVEVNLTITDVEAGTTRVYTNASGQPFEPIQDTSAFSTCNEAALRHVPTERSSASIGESGICPNGALCLNQGRFRVDLEFETPEGIEGDGQPTVLTDDTGSFWFFDQDNVEALVKVLDACALGNRYWVFAAGLTDVAATLTVTDTLTGAVQTYDNPQSTPFRPVIDTDAFASCP